MHDDLVKPWWPSWAFGLCYVIGWSLYGAMLTWSSDAPLAWPWESHLWRMALTLPIVLSFRYLYIRNEWNRLSPFEVINFVLGVNLLFALVAAFLVPFSIDSSELWFELFQRESTRTSRQFDEKFISFLYSYIFQVIWCLIYIWYKSYRQTQVLEQKEAVIEHELKDAKINALLNQVSPHFLFNGLNNLCSLMDEDVQRSQRILRSFSDLLRYFMEANNHEKVALRQELKFVENYISVLSLQYEDRLVFTTDVPESITGYCIPPMILQLMVENSIKHSVAKRKGMSHVRVEGEDEEYFYCLRVINEGTLEQKSEHDRVGVGVRNISERLSLLYGKNGGFRLYEENAEVIASVRIPKERFYESGNY